VDANRDELVLQLLIELKEDVSALHVKVGEIVNIREDVDKLKRDVNVTRGVVLAVGAAFSIIVAIFSRLFKQ